jgi:cytochrome P450
MRTTLLYIISQPLVYFKLQSEIDMAERNHHLSKPVIRDTEARQLPYLQACIKEGLRIWPPVTGLMEKEVPPQGDVIHGKFIPGGTHIGYCAWGMHRSKAVFGEDSDMYRPERWLEARGEELHRMEKVFELVFGYGRFYCLGKTVALIELNKVFVEV